MIQNKILRLPSNTKGRDFVCGDLHGCMNELEAGLIHLNFDPCADRLFLVGDLTDRGPRSIDALSLLTDPWCYSVLGNHDEFVLHSILHNNIYAQDMWANNGGDWIRYLIAEEYNKVVDYCSLLEDLPKIISVGNGDERFNIVHAELFQMGSINLPNFDFSDSIIDKWFKTGIPMQHSETLHWGRTLTTFDSTLGVPEVSPGKFINLSPTYCGHNTKEEITTFAQHINIDCGCCYAYRSIQNSIARKLVIVEPELRSGITIAAKSFEIFNVSY